MIDAARDRKQAMFWLVLLGAAGTFALTMGTRQTMGLFMSPLNTATGLGIGSISLAFAFGQLWWGLTQPFAGSFGQFIMAPIAGFLMDSMGWSAAMQVLGLVVLLCLPSAFLLKGNSLQSSPAGQKVVGTKEAIRTALHNPSYLLLAAGFFVCGFHVAFLATHLPGVIAACGLPVKYAAWALAMIGLFNIVGSVAMGWAVGRWRMKSLLSLVYAVRGLAVLVFLFALKTGPVVLVFAAVMGVTFLSTVPPTAGLVAKFFGTANMATLFGIVMLAHQIGGFLGAWLGGRVFQATGSYDWVWYIDIVLAAGAALVHLPIKEAMPVRAKVAAA